jgi:hypothetical protein
MLVRRLVPQSPADARCRAARPACPLVTSAPSVNSERPIRPVIGAGTVVKRRLICATLSAARVWAMAACDWRAAAAASV